MRGTTFSLSARHSVAVPTSEEMLQTGEVEEEGDLPERTQPAASPPPSAAQGVERHGERVPPRHDALTRDEPAENGAPRGQATGFVTAQLYTMSHHIEKAQYAAVERGLDTFTLVSYTKTYAAMEYTPTLPLGQEDKWLQTMAKTLGQVLGFSTPLKLAQIKDPRAEHRVYRNWRLEAPNMALTMGVSTNRGIPQYFWLQGKEWLVRNATKHLTPKGLDAALGAEESAQPAEPQLAQQAPRLPPKGQGVRDTASPYDEVMRRVPMSEAPQVRVEGPGGPATANGSPAAAT